MKYILIPFSAIGWAITLLVVPLLVFLWGFSPKAYIREFKFIWNRNLLHHDFAFWGYILVFLAWFILYKDLFYMFLFEFVYLPYLKFRYGF